MSGRATPEALRGLAADYNGREVGDGGLVQQALLDAAQHIEAIEGDKVMMRNMLDRSDALSDRLLAEQRAARPIPKSQLEENIGQQVIRLLQMRTALEDAGVFNGDALATWTAAFGALSEFMRITVAGPR